MQSLYDPLAPLGKYRPLAWGLLALAVIGFQGPRFLASLPGDVWNYKDFFQDWAAAKYARDGISPYTHLIHAVETYLQIPIRDQEGKEIFHFNIHFNAHPPPSLYFAIPFSLLPFSQAALAWNLASVVLFCLSLVLVWKTLEICFPPWGIFPLIVITLMGGPLISQFDLAQWNFLYLFFLVLLWRALKGQRWVEAGFWLGTVAALKLFPLLLALSWLLQKRWRAVGSSLAAFFLLNILACCCFGFQIFPEYYYSKLPRIWEFAGSANNYSWGGLFNKLFPSDPLNLYSPSINASLIGKPLSLICFILFIGLWLTLVKKFQPGEETAFLWGLFALLLAGPITWDHYIVIAIPGIVYCWKKASAFPKVQPLFLIGLFAILVPQGNVQYLLKSSGWLTGPGGPLCSLTFQALPTYGLTLLFALLLYMEKPISHKELI